LQTVPVLESTQIACDSWYDLTNRYRAGYSSYLEQIDAERQLLSAQLSLTQVEADAITARVNLYQAMGGGWNREAIAEEAVN
jgi:outer membrane protein, multidrug efflux system